MKTVMTSFRIPGDLLEKLKIEAKTKKISVSKLIIRIIKEGVK